MDWEAATSVAVTADSSGCVLVFDFAITKVYITFRSCATEMLLSRICRSITAAVLLRFAGIKSSWRN